MKGKKMKGNKNERGTKLDVKRKKRLENKITLPFVECFRLI